MGKTTKLNTEEFIKRAIQKHGNKYDYSKAEYINSKTKICIICPEHGEFWQTPNNHLNGSGCVKCQYEKLSNEKRIYKHTLETFIEKARSIHGDKYDYSQTHFTYVNKPVNIVCHIKDEFGNEHGVFSQTPINHFKGCGCPKCASNYKKTNNEFVSLLKIKDSEGKLDFDKVNYVNNNTPVIITCLEHGDFTILPSSIKDKLECPECQKTRLHNQFAKTTEDFITEAKRNHIIKYDYSKTLYKSYNKKVSIICPEHGEFKQLASVHLKGGDCPKCASLKGWMKRSDKMSTETFIKKANEKHWNYYDYSKVHYVNAQTKVYIICPEHGGFKQMPYAHLNGQGCPSCSNEKTFSEGEKQVGNFIKNLGFNITLNNRRLISSSELDIYVPEKKLAVEYNGLYWHNELKCKDNPVIYHLDKTNKCFEKGIRLIHIFEDEWIEKKEIVKSRLKSILGVKGCAIRAHKCIIRDISSKESKLFLEQNHIQGNVNAKYRYGLYYNEELVSLMTFGGLRKNLGQKSEEGKYELLRFCNKINTTVYGGASKLLKHFIKEVCPKYIISYADKRWSNGNLYKQLGFDYLRDSKPNYYYVVGQHRENRFKYRKSELIKKYNCPKTMSEHDFCLSQKWYRIYDCGTMVFGLKL